MSLVYIASKLFTYFVLPPGIFILLFILMAFYVKKFKKIFLFFGLCFYLLSNTFVANLLLEPLEKPYNKVFDKNTKADAVVVLGGGNIIPSANLPLASGANKRALYGLMLAKSQNLPLLFSGGGLIRKYSEANSFVKTMQELQKGLSINLKFSQKIQRGKFVILTEDRSLDTFQNAKFTKDKFADIGIKNPTIFLVTSAYHMRRAKELYEYFGFRVIPTATDFKIDYKSKGIFGYLPDIGAFNRSYIALHEYAGLLSLMFRLK